MEEDKEIDKLNFDINQLINKCIILNKDELTATARVMLGRDIILRFINILQENKQLKEENEDLKMKIQFISKNNIDDLYEKALVKTMTKFLNNNIKEDYIPVSKIKEKYEKNKARTDCRYCNNTCDSYAVCMFCKKILEEK